MAKGKHAREREKTGIGGLLLLFLLLCVVIGALFIHKSGKGGAAARTEVRVGTALQAQGGRTMLAPYSESCYPFSGDVSVSDAARQGDKLLLSGHGAEGDVLGLAGFSLEDNGRVRVSEAERLSLDAPEEANEAAIYDLSAGGDGLFYVLTGGAPESRTGEFAILRYTQDGAFQDKMTVSAFPEDTEGGLSLCAGSQGEMVLLGADYVYFLPWQGTPSNRQSLERLSFTGAVSTGDGIVVSVHNYLLDASPFYRVDSQTGTLSRLDISNPVDPSVDAAGFKLVWGGSEAPCQGLDGEYISNSGESFVLFDFANDSYRELLRWNTSNALAGPSCRLTENAFLCVEPGSGSLLLTGLEEVPYVEKSPVKVALVGLDSEAEVQAMNSKSRECEYQIVKYGREELDRFRTELSAGGSMDLVLFYDGINTNSAYFEDLYPYLDADPELSRDDFLPNLLESTSVRGELHQLWDRAAVSTLVGKASYVGDGRGLTPGDYVRMVEESEVLKGVFDNFMGKDELLARVANLGISTCVDKDKASCDFTAGSFQELLAWCQSMGAGNQEGSGAGLEPDEYILGPGYVNMPVGDTYDPTLGDTLVYVGFPNGGEGFHAYTPVYGGLTMAIPANSANKDGAWAFIRDRLSLDTQLALGEGALPVHVEALRRQAEAGSTEAGREALYGLLERTKYAETFSDDALREIIISSGQSYLNGDKSLEETAQLVQSRASVYVAEQYG